MSGDVVQRIWEHRSGAVPGFTRRYAVSRLVRFEVFDDVRAAIQRERDVTINLMYAADGEKRDGLVGAWHPRDSTNKLVISDFRW